MSWELWSAPVVCECGAEYEYVVEHPPIPMIVRSFYDDEGRAIGDDCLQCGAMLPVPVRSEQLAPAGGADREKG